MDVERARHTGPFGQPRWEVLDKFLFTSVMREGGRMSERYERWVVAHGKEPETLAEPGGTMRHSQLAAGASYFRPAGVEHDVINDNDFDFVFVEIEMKVS